LLLQGALSGLALGGVYAIMAVSLVLMARLIRVINFAVAAVGMFGAYAAQAVVQVGGGGITALICGALIGAVISLLIGLIITTWLAEADVGARSATTVGALLLLLSLSFVLFGTAPMAFRPIVTGSAFTIGSVVISNITLTLLVSALLIAAAAKAVLTFTMIGTQLRAISDRPITAELLGLNVAALTLSVWALSGLIVTLVIMVVAPVQTSDASSLALLVIPATAAALFAQFQRLDLALIGGLGLGTMQGILAQMSGTQVLRDWLPLLLILCLLLWAQRRETWDEAR